MEFINTYHLQPTVHSCLAVYNSCKFFSVNVPDQIRAEGIGAAPDPSALDWSDIKHPSHILSNPKSQEKTPGLLLKPRRCEVKGDPWSRCMSQRAWLPGKHSLLSSRLVLIFWIRWIFLEDSDPQCGQGPVQDRGHCLYRKLLQNQHPAPTQEGSIHLERRIFCGGPDQNYSPTLNVWQERVLQIQAHIKRERENSKHGREEKTMRWQEIKSKYLMVVVIAHWLMIF